MSVNNWIGGNITGTLSGSANFFGFANEAVFTTTTETEVRSKYPAGTASLMSVFIGSVSGTPTMTSHFRKNAANGNQTATTSAGGTGWVTDSTHSDTTVDGDQVDGSVTPSGASVTFNGAASILLVHATDGVQIYQSNTGVNLSSGNNSHESPFGGSMQFPAATTASRTQLKTAATLSHLIAVVTNQASAGTITFITMKAGVAANQSAAFASGVNGDSEDTTHTDSVTSGDQWSFSYSGITTNFVTAWSVKVRSNNSGNTPADTASSSESLSSSSTYTSYFMCPNGGASDSKNATETLAETIAPVKLGTHSLRYHLESNTMNQASSLVVRKNGSSGSQTATLASATNGWSVDATHSDTYNVSDLASVMFSTTSTTGSYILKGTGFTTDVGVSVETGAGLMSFNGISLGGNVFQVEGSAGAMHFAGIGINGVAGRREFTTGAMAFKGISISAVGNVIAETVNGAMHFPGITIKAFAFRYGAPGTGAVHFWTFGA